MSARPPVVRFPGVSGRVIALGVCAQLAAASTFAADAGASGDDAAGPGDALAGGAVVGVAPKRVAG